MQTMNIEGVLTPRQAAEWLKISTRNLWSLEQNGQIRSIRFGRSVRYDMADLVAFVESRKPLVAATKNFAT